MPFDADLVVHLDTACLLVVALAAALGYEWDVNEKLGGFSEETLGLQVVWEPLGVSDSGTCVVDVPGLETKKSGNSGDGEMVGI